MHEAHWKWWPIHEEAEAAYPPEELVPNFKCALLLVACISRLAKGPCEA